MSSFPSNSIETPSPRNRQPWEEPGLVVERSLVARAQGGGDTDETWALQRLLGPLSTSGGSGDCG